MVHIQFNFGFFELHRLASLIEDQRRMRRVILTMHSTEDVEVDTIDLSLADIAPALQRVDAILVHQAVDAERLAAFGIATNVHVVPHGMPGADLPSRDVVRKALGLDRRLVIGTFGFLLPHKGTLDLIRAIDIMRRDLPDVFLLATSALHPDLRSVAYFERCREEIERLGLAHNVTLVTEFLPEDAARAFLMAADVIVLPYEHTQESASAALRFALSAERPVLVSDLPLFADAADAVEVVPDTSPEGLAAAIATLLGDNAALADVVARARGLTQATSWDVVARDHRQFYVSGRQPRSGLLPPLEEDVKDRADAR